MVNAKSMFHELIDSYYSKIVSSNYGKAKYNAFFFYPLGTLEDWDAAVQKTENRLARVNEQRAKVRAFCELPKQLIGNTYVMVMLV